MTEDRTDIDPLMLLFGTADAADDPAPAYATLRTECPVARTTGLMGEPAVWVSRFEEVQWALKHPEVFSSEAEGLDIGQQHDLIPLQIDPPLHTKYRRMLSEWFAPRAINALEPGLRALVAERLDEIAGRGECEYHEEFATPYPSNAFLHLMGLPQSDLPMYLQWRDDIIRPPAEGEDPAQVRARTGAAITDYFRTAIEEVRANPREGLLNDLVHAEFDGRPLDEGELLGLGFLLIIAGLDTVTATLDCFMRFLAEHPEHRRQIVEEPELIPDAIEEMLRVLTPVQVVPRLVKQDAELDGVAIHAGDHATMVLGAANLDPAVFDRPEEMDFKRPRAVHMAFGGGPHHCLGINLARLELRVALEEWHRRIPEYSLAEGAEIHHSPGIRQTDHLPLVFPTS